MSEVGRVVGKDWRSVEWSENMGNLFSGGGWWIWVISQRDMDN